MATNEVRATLDASDIRQTLRDASKAIQIADKRIVELEAENTELRRMYALASEVPERISQVLRDEMSPEATLERIIGVLNFAVRTQLDTARRKFVPETLREKLEHAAWGEDLPV